jgi:predicted RNA-binding Zn ribbon-like protein
MSLPVRVDLVASAEFLLVGNHPATDLCNTTPVVDGIQLDVLSSFDDFLRWSVAAGVDLPTARYELTPRQGSATVAWVKNLRDALRPLLDPTSGTDDPSQLNDVLSQAEGHLALAKSENGLLVRVVTQHPSAAIRLAVSEAVLDVFSYPAELVRRCANPTCVLLFLDLSRNARRRWCDMSTCGNRAKAATHYRRRRNSAASSRSSPR